MTTEDRMIVAHKDGRAQYDAGVSRGAAIWNAHVGYATQEERDAFGVGFEGNARRAATFRYDVATWNGPRVILITNESPSKRSNIPLLGTVVLPSASQQYHWERNS
jgi:hypothetical protein